MREACCLWLSAADSARLAAIGANRNSPRSMSGGPGSCCSRPTGWARSRSCVGPANPSPASGAGRRAILRLGSAGSCTTRPGPRASAARGRSGRAGGRAHTGAAARRGDPLDGARDGPGHRHLAGLGAADLGGARAFFAPAADVASFSTDPAFAQRNCATWSGSMSTSRPMRSCSRSTRSPRSRHSNTASQALPR